MSLYAGHLPHRQKRGRVPGQRPLEVLLRGGGAQDRMSVKVCIVGCGAIGSIFGAHLARLEEVEVYAYDVNKEHVRAIHERGLRISGAADFTVHLEATSDVSQIPACDLGIVATKSTH